MDLEFVGLKRQNVWLIVVVILLVILGIVSFNAYSVWYIKAQNDIKLGAAVGAGLGIDLPSYARKK
uniref:Uncharacterized protein n=1 Tax=Mimivirus LCMiAC02 TaxID=2506609 RepID=A0A4D5XF07_9VIRU|nr:MAG: hypothetical protein LCMiAC02_03310 [Mimivirus LCMiAC02]